MESFIDYSSNSFDDQTYDGDDEVDFVDYGDLGSSSPSGSKRSNDSVRATKKTTKSKAVKYNNYSDSDSDDVEILPFGEIDGIFFKPKGISKLKEDSKAIINIHTRRADLRTRNLVTLSSGDRKVVQGIVSKYINGNKKYNTEKVIVDGLDDILKFGKFSKDIPEDTIAKIDEILELYSNLSKQIHTDRSALKIMGLAKKPKTI
jgi:hypothetical protein